MKRGDLLRHLKKHGCEMLREGSAHSVFIKPGSHGYSVVPRHNEIPKQTVRKICRELGIESPPGGWASNRLRKSIMDP